MTKSENDKLSRSIFTHIMGALGAALAIYWRWSYGEAAGFLLLLIGFDLVSAWIGVKLRERRERLTLRSRAVVH